MRIAVCLKYVPDLDTVEVHPLTGEIDPVRTLYMTNPADEAALEIALQLRSNIGEVTALTVGAEHTETVLRDALAVGADRAVRLWDEDFTETHPSMTALLLATALKTDNLPDLVLCGDRSVDRSTGKVPALLSEHLDWPVVTDVTAFELNQGTARVLRRLERGARAESEVRLPAVLGLEAGLARLRHASLPGLMAAKQAQIPTKTLSDLGLSLQDLNFPIPTLREAMPPKPRPRAIFIPDSRQAPYERVAQIMAAGVVKKSGKVLEGPPEAMADAIIEFLREHGFIGQSA